MASQQSPPLQPQELQAAFSSWHSPVPDLLRRAQEGTLVEDAVSSTTRLAGCVLHHTALYCTVLHSLYLTVPYGTMRCWL